MGGCLSRPRPPLPVLALRSSILLVPTVQLRAVARAGCRAKRGHWLPPRDHRWATVTHWFLPSICWTPCDRDAPSTAHLRLEPLCVSVSPGRARRPGWSGRLCPSLGDPVTSQHRPGIFRLLVARDAQSSHQPRWFRCFVLGDGTGWTKPESCGRG